MPKLVSYLPRLLLGTTTLLLLAHAQFAHADLDISILVQQQNARAAVQTQTPQPTVPQRQIATAQARPMAPTSTRLTTPPTATQQLFNQPQLFQTTPNTNYAGLSPDVLKPTNNATQESITASSTPASEPDDAESQYRLAREFDARGTPESLRDAARLYEAAGNQGHANAQTNLGLMYAEGHGVLRSDRKAAVWLEQAGEQGHAIAQYSLGLMYYEGRGVRRDHGTAIKWYQSAAESGNAKAMNNMGIMYALGKGVTSDDVSAYAWFSAAALAGEEDGAVNRDLIAEQIPQTKRAKAVSAAKALQQKLEL